MNQGRWHLRDRLRRGRGHDDVQHVEVGVVQQASVDGAGPAARSRRPAFLSRISEALTGVVASEIERCAELVRAEVHQDLHALSDHELHARHSHRRIEQAGIIADDKEGAVVAKAQVIAALDLSIQDAQTHDLLRQFDLRIHRAVDQHVVAVVVQDVVIRELVVRHETTACQCQRNVVHAIRSRQCQRSLLRIAHDDEPTRALGELFLRGAMQMRMIPIRGRIILHRECRRPCGARRHDLMRSAIHDRGDVEAMPMHRRGVGEAVRHVDLNVVALVHDQRGTPKVGAVVAIGLRLRTFPELLARLAQFEVECLARDRLRDHEGVVVFGV